jgi:thiosulfate oxidation carrier complex protein SoxZ
MKRRSFLGFGISAILLMPFKLMAAAWNNAAFSAKNSKGAEQALAIDGEIESNDIEIKAPSRAENGAIVQVEINSHIPNTEAIALLVDRNPTALIGNYIFNHGALPTMVTRIKMAETSDIKVIVKSGNQYFTAKRLVTVLENGCGGSSSVNEEFFSSMKIRAKLLADTPDVAQVKAIITHPMHTGQGKDLGGALIPAHFIQTITIRHNEKPVIEMQLGTGIAKNPYLTFYISDANLGDKVHIEWSDNLGNTDNNETWVIA